MENVMYDPDVKNPRLEFMETECKYGHTKLLKMMTYDYCFLDPVKRWCNRPLSEIEEDCDVLKIRIFWPLLFSKDDLDGCALIRCMDDTGIDKKRLENIEILEDIIDLGKSVCGIPCFIRIILSFDAYKEAHFDGTRAMEWVKSTGNVEAIKKIEMLGDRAWPSLQVFFTEYKYHIEKVTTELRSLKEEFDDEPCISCNKKSELLKTRGNKEFSRERFELAIKWYTKAIEYCPENYLLYGNRALCYLRTAEYKLALADGKRATILKPKWSKGHYRFCDALFGVGEHERAFAANLKAHNLCAKDPDGVKDLTLQNLRFRRELEIKTGPAPGVLEMKKSWQNDASEHEFSTSLNTRITKKDRKKTQPASKGSIKKTDSKASTKSDEDDKKMLSELSAGCIKPNLQAEPRSSSPPGNPNRRFNETDHPREPDVSKIGNLENQKMNSTAAFAMDDLNGLPDMVKTLAHSGYTALLDKCFHSAEQAFSQLLDILDPEELKKLHLSTIDYVVLIYGHANSLLGIGQPEELTMAEQQFNNIIEKYTKHRFNCLAFYGIGNVHLRQNRFAEARNHFVKSQTMLNRKIVPGVLKWPTTTVVIEETRSETLQMLLEKCIDECKFPPKPDAICRYPQCHGRNKKQIYFTDPDFEGFIRVFCCHLCKVEFHIDCWKKLKASEYSDKNDKDFLEANCFTPDCNGIVCHIVIYGSSGLVKWQDEIKMTKMKTARKPIVKQKNASSNKLNVKEERKLRRKMHRKGTLDFAVDIKVAPPKEENSSKDTSVNICLADPMLQHIVEKAELIKMGVYDTSLLISNLYLWCVLSKEEHTTYSASNTSSSRDEVMTLLINHITKKGDKVKTRIFLHVLNELHEVDSKLHSWLNEINNIGLLAAEVFLTHYGDCLQKLDLGSLCSLWNETYGNKLKSPIPSCKVEVATKYFSEASPDKARCLVWLLEEHKERFLCPVLHQALDRFFTVMDRPGVVLKKQDNQDASSNYIKVKNKNRKKKQKEPKPLIVLSGGIGTLAQEDGRISTEENTLVVLSSNEPFVVPENIRDQVNEFELSYEDIPSSNGYMKLMDNKNLTRESLYEYFFQILDKHGPLQMDDELFVGEYELFPPEAHKLVEEAGGLKPFLLASLRFFMVADNLIGLLKHTLLHKEVATTLTESVEFKAKLKTAEYPLPLSSVNIKLFSDYRTLNPGAKEFKPVSEIFHEPSYREYSSSYSESNSQSGESIGTSDTSPIANSIIQPQPVPFQFSAGQTISFSGGMPLPLVPTDAYTQAVPFMAPTPNVVIQPVSIKGSKSDTPLSDMEAALDRDSVCETIYSDSMEVHNCAYGTQTPYYNPNGETVFKDVSSNASVEFRPSLINMEKKKKPSLTRMVAVQVVIEFSAHSINTDPFHPFEKQQGDILRLEKEHQVLQEQLKEATEKYELSKFRNTEEITAVEKQLQKVTEENKISKAELDWFYQDLENEVKKWHQDKKDHQERLKSMKNNIKVLMENNESCLRNIDEKEQQYKNLLNEFLESSNKFANEKMKLEENIKKGRDNLLESTKRAVDSERSFLENQKNIEIFKLCCAMSMGENNLYSLRRSVSPSALPQVTAQIMSWNSYLSNIEKEIQNVRCQFEERISLVISGAKLSSLQEVQVTTFQPPTSVPIQGKTSVNGPAVTCSTPAPQLHSSSIPAFSISNDPGSAQPSINAHNGCNTDVKISNPLTYSSVQMPYDSVGISPSQKTPVNHSMQAGGANPNLHSGKTVSDVPPLASRSVNASPTKKQEPKNPYDRIVAHLNTIFPHYDGSELSNFVKEARAKNGGSFSGLDASDVVSRVTEYILDLQSKSPPQKEMGQSASGTSVNWAGQTWVPMNSSNNNSRSTKQVAQSTQPWKSVVETSKSTWQPSKDSASFDEDPCIICHEELRQDIIYTLECGHQFHKHCIKTWLNAQSTCPTCRVHVLLTEDFPLLTSRKRPT
ncbi:E3 ubiquitin-protein ligase TTC3 [Ambystoma mexicanum]|uniref:E3 ubiquitin-protein ligase TTC3 n=1 Tax=Ambystoma mexicanum TaxID=8296 RepID=UPI0037E954B4